MTTKQSGTLFAIAILAIEMAGCLSNNTISGIVPHRLKVVDAVTKLPVAGADVKLTAPGMLIGNTTDERGAIDVGAYAFYSMPKPEEIEITRSGYNRVAFKLTNGLPATVEITPLPNQK